MISLIAAISENGVIGRDGGLPWRLADDLRRFKQLTTGHAVVMGRRTFDSIGRALPDRTNIVVTRDRSRCLDGAIVAGDLDAALAAAAEDPRGLAHDEVFILGGAEIYRLALPRADRLYLTIVHAEVEGDVRFPPFDRADWRLVRSEDHPADERNEHACTFEVLDRVRTDRDHSAGSARIVMSPTSG